MTIYKSLTIDHMLLIHWQSAPTSGSLVSILNESQALSRRVGDKIHLVFVTTPPIPALDGAVRQELLRLVPKLLEYVSEVHNVVLGTGFWASALRSMFAGLVLAAGYRNLAFVHSSMLDALNRISRHRPTNVQLVLRRLSAEGWPTD